MSDEASSRNGNKIDGRRLATDSSLFIFRAPVPYISRHLPVDGHELDCFGESPAPPPASPVHL